jgi:hypothetical protein
VDNATNLLAMAGTMALGKALATPVIRTLSGDDKTEYRGGGPTHILSQVQKLANTGDLMTFVRGQGILRPEMQVAAEMLNRKSKGANLTDLWGTENADAGDKAALFGNLAKQVARQAAAPVMWGQDVLDSTTGKKDATKAAVLQLLGGSTGKTNLEARVSIAQGSSLPPDDASLEGDARLQSKKEAGQFLANGDVSGLQKMMVEGRLKNEDLQKMLVESIDSRPEKLATKLKKFTMDKAQPMLNVATPEEYNAALPMMIQKADDATKTGKHLDQVIAFYKGLMDRIKKGHVSSDFDIDPADLEEAIAGIRSMRKEKQLGTEQAVEELDKE